MPTDCLSRAVDELRRAVWREIAGDATDGELLECFLARRDEAAVAALVARHGPMVMGVCRRVTAHDADAEDAFQATFLVFVRKAASIVPRENVGNWLYGVAYRAALKTRALASRRRTNERQVLVMPEPAARIEEGATELQALLDEELNRLPAKLRLPVVLCDLEGRTRRDVARQLQLPDGTLSNRLAAARQLLARRLTARGLSISGGTLVALLPSATQASVPAALQLVTVKAATVVAAGGAATAAVSTKVVVISEGVLKTMLLTKLMCATVVLAIAGLIGTGTCWLLQPALAQKSTPTNPAEKPAASDQVVGVIKAIDAAKPSITLTVQVAKGQPAEEKAFDVTKDAKIYLADKKEGKFGDLSVKLVVSLTLSNDSKVTAIRIARPAETSTAVAGVLKAEAAAKNSITLTVPGGKNQPAEDRTFDVATDATILIDGTKKAKLGDLPLGVQITLQLSANGKVIAIAATGPSVSGPLKAVDATKNTLTLTVNASKGNPGEDRVFDVAKDAAVSLDKQGTKLGDLTVGTPVTVVLSVDQKQAIRVWAATVRPQPSSVRGQLTTFDAGKEKITITIQKGKGQPGEEQSFSVPKEAKVVLDLGRDAKLGDLVAGALVTVELSADDRVIAVRAVGPNLDAVWQSLDKDTVKVLVNVTKGNPGDEKSYPLAKDVKLTVSKAQPVKLTELTAGTKVVLGMSVDQKSVISVTAEQ